MFPEQAFPTLLSLSRSAPMLDPDYIRQVTNKARRSQKLFSAELNCLPARLVPSSPETGCSCGRP